MIACKRDGTEADVFEVDAVDCTHGLCDEKKRSVLVRCAVTWRSGDAT